jgi:hypothetical protein
MSQPDVMVLDCGALVQFLVFTDTARAWVDANIVAADWQWIGTLFLCGEQRYAANLINGMKAAGLIVKAGEFERVDLSSVLRKPELLLATSG